VGDLLPVVNACKTAIEKLEEWATPEKPQLTGWHQSLDVSVHPVPRGVVLTISSVVLLSLSPEYLVYDRHNLFTVRGTILLFSPCARLSVQSQQDVPR